MLSSIDTECAIALPSYWLFGQNEKDWVDEPMFDLALWKQRKKPFWMPEDKQLHGSLAPGFPTCITEWVMPVLNENQNWT